MLPPPPFCQDSVQETSADSSFTVWWGSPVTHPVLDFILRGYFSLVIQTYLLQVYLDFLFLLESVTVICVLLGICLL